MFPCEEMEEDDMMMRHKILTPYFGQFAGTKADLSASVAPLMAYYQQFTNSCHLLIKTRPSLASVGI